MPQLPNLMYDVFNKAKNGEFQFSVDDKQMQQLRDEMRANNRRTYGAIVGSALLISGSVIAALDGFQKTMLGPVPLITVVLSCFGIAILLAAWPRR